MKGVLGGTRRNERRDQLSRFRRSRMLGRMADFVDPRANPEPPPTVSRDPAAHMPAIEDAAGRITAHGDRCPADLQQRVGR